MGTQDTSNNNSNNNSNISATQALNALLASVTGNGNNNPVVPSATPQPGSGINVPNIMGGLLQGAGAGLTSAGNFMNPPSQINPTTGLHDAHVQALTKATNKAYQQQADNFVKYYGPDAGKQILDAQTGMGQNLGQNLGGQGMAPLNTQQQQLLQGLPGVGQQNSQPNVNPPTPNQAGQTQLIAPGQTNQTGQGMFGAQQLSDTQKTILNNIQQQLAQISSPENKPKGMIENLFPNIKSKQDAMKIATLHLAAEAAGVQPQQLEKFQSNIMPLTNYEQGFLMLQKAQILAGVGGTASEQYAKDVGPDLEGMQKGLTVQNMWNRMAPTKDNPKGDFNNQQSQNAFLDSSAKYLLGENATGKDLMKGRSWGAAAGGAAKQALGGGGLQQNELQRIEDAVVAKYQSHAQSVNIKYKSQMNRLRNMGINGQNFLPEYTAGNNETAPSPTNAITEKIMGATYRDAQGNTTVYNGE